MLGSAGSAWPFRLQAALASVAARPGSVTRARDHRFPQRPRAGFLGSASASMMAGRGDYLGVSVSAWPAASRAFLNRSPPVPNGMML